MENNPTFLNFPLFIRASFDCLGESGTEALVDAINYYLSHATNGEFGCWEDILLLYSLLFAFVCEGFNYTKEAFCALHGKRREFMEAPNNGK